jgi:hypothetical protein
MITWEAERVPELGSYCNEDNKYYLVKPEGYGPIKAMYIDGEWWPSHITKLMVDIEGWTEI